MKKLLWFTKEQAELLDTIKALTKENNSEVVRSAMEIYFNKLIGDSIVKHAEKGLRDGK